MSRLCAGALTLVVAAGCDEGGDVVGPSGGIVESRDGRVLLAIPPGALAEEVVVSIEEIDDGPAGAIGRIYEITPRLTALTAPAELVYDYGTDAEALSLAGASVDDVALVTEKAEGWRQLADHALDHDEETVSGSVMVFSTYAVVVD